jgi:aminotransferase
MLKNTLSEREEELPSSVMARLLKIAAEDPSVISLGPGEPDISPPLSVIRAIKLAANKRLTKYSSPAGMPELIEQIGKKLKKENGIDAGPENILVTCGSSEGLLLSLMACIDPGEGVLFPDPGFLAYRPLIEMLSGAPLPVRLSEDNGWQFDVDAARRAIMAEKTKAIIINSPANPTGVVFSKSVLEEIAAFAIEYGLLIISDEAYEKYVYEGRHISIASLNGMSDHVITLHSCSKSLAIPGLRLGWASGPERFISAMTKMHLYTTICAPTISQAAVVNGLKDRRFGKKIVREYNKRRLFICKSLKKIVHFVWPEGAFYIFPSVPAGFDSQTFSEWLLKSAKVMVVPGNEFGPGGEGYFRISYAVNMRLLKEAVERIKAAIK